MPFVFARALLLFLALPVLTPGAPVEQELAGGQAQSFRIEAKGQPLLVTVEQHGVDVVLDLWAGTPRGIIDTAIEREGTETWLIQGTGEYRLEIRPASQRAPKGRFRLQVEELASAAPEDLRRIEGERLMTEAGILFTQKTGKAQQEALTLYTEALAHWQALGRKREEARALFRLAVIHQRLGQSQLMLDRLQEARPLFASLGDKAREADVLTYIGLALCRLGRYAEAIESNERSLEIRRPRHDKWGEAVTSQNLCLIRLHLSEWREAIQCYENLLPLLEEVGEPDAEAFNGLGGAYSNLGEPEKAREYYTRSLEKRRTLNDRMNEWKVLNNLAALAVDQDELGDALFFYGEALDAVRKVGDREWGARVLSNLGGAYLDIGEPQRALDLLNEALPIRHEVGDRRGEAATLLLIGLAHERLGDVAAALEPYEQALQIAQEMEDPAGEAFALGQLGQAHFRAGDLDRALSSLNRAAALHRSRAGLASVLQRIGEVEARLGQREKALTTLREALALRREFGDSTVLAETLGSLATVERGVGRLQEAVAHAEEAVSLVESARTTVADPGLRASLLASRRHAFDLAIDLRMDLGHSEEALALSERARARSLLDLLREARNEILDGMPSELRERQASLNYQLGHNARELRSPSLGDERRIQLQREQADLLAKADLLEDQIRRSNPRYAALDQPPLDAAAIRGLLDPDTVLLEYSLGEERSFLWLVTPDRVESFELPGRAEIEGAALRSYKDLSSLKESDAEAHRTLSRLLFGKVADRLHCQRLVIVADGALQYVPFAVLPDPQDSSGNVPLVVGHEIVSLPSASVLDIQRRVLAGRPRAKKAVAILANPVFTPWDARLPKQDGPRSPAPAPGERFQPLPASEREAKAIADLLTPDQVFLALGTMASRATALSGSLAGHRAVHFATHGEIDSETPRLSFLALSMFDEKGQPQEGYLRLSDVYNLKLDADLVVLSGCKTALGREIRGEGLMGLTQGFFYAGAERVLASLWLVEDHATAKLMSHFYRAMLKEGLPPAAALRAAQLSVRGDPHWQDPFYWAPFTLQGDWR